MTPVNSDLLFKNFPLPKVVAAPSKKPSFKHFKPIAPPNTNANNTAQNNTSYNHNTMNKSNGANTYVSPFNHDSMEIDSDNGSHVMSNQSHVSVSNSTSHVTRNQQPVASTSKDQLLPSRANNTSTNTVNKTSPPLPQKQPPATGAGNNNTGANKSNGTAKSTPNMNAITNSLLNKRPRNTFYGKASGENDDEEEEQSPPQQQDKPRDFKTGFERLVRPYLISLYKS